MTYDAGIDWEEQKPAHAKLLMGIAMLDSHFKYGNPKDFYSLNNNKSVQLIGDLMPGMIDYIKERYIGKQPLSKYLSWRGRAIIPKHMGGNAQYNDFIPLIASLELIWDCYHNNKIVTFDNIAEAQERLILSQQGKCSGVYIRFDPLVIERGYVGEGKNLSKRNKAHNNSPYRIYSFLATIDKICAVTLQNMILDQLTYKLGYTVTGKFEVPTGSDAMKVVGEIIKIQHIQRFYNTVKIVELKEQETKAKLKLPAYWDLDVLTHRRG